MNATVRIRAHPFAALIEPMRGMLAHDRLSELHLDSHVCTPMDGPPLLRSGDVSQEAYDAVIESEAAAAALIAPLKRPHRARCPKK